jgi:hypothetical protein
LRRKRACQSRISAADNCSPPGLISVVTEKG